MTEYASNCPISGPRSTGWKATWDIGGLAWSYYWGFFYDVSSTDGQVPIQPPSYPSRGGI